jgi:hypothetical protein
VFTGIIDQDALAFVAGFSVVGINKQKDNSLHLNVRLKEDTNPSFQIISYIRITKFWDVIPCSLVVHYGCFGGTCCL